MAVSITGQQKTNHPKNITVVEANLPLIFDDNPTLPADLQDASSYLNEDSMSGKRDGAMFICAAKSPTDPEKIDTSKPVTIFMATGSHPEDEWVYVAHSSDYIKPTTTRNP